jgi:hypothetical protein
LFLCQSKGLTEDLSTSAAWIRIQFGPWIRIRLQIAHLAPDPPF